MLYPLSYGRTKFVYRFLMLDTRTLTILVKQKPTDKLMEEPMIQRTLKHEIKLQQSVIVILSILAIGVCGIAFAPVLTVSGAFANHTRSHLNMGYRSSGPIYIQCVKGCN